MTGVGHPDDTPGVSCRYDLTSFAPYVHTAFVVTRLVILRRGDDAVGNPHRTQIYQFELFELIRIL